MYHQNFAMSRPLCCFYLVMMVEVVKKFIPRLVMVCPISSANSFSQKKDNWIQLNRYQWFHGLKLLYVCSKMGAEEFVN